MRIQKSVSYSIASSFRSAAAGLGAPRNIRSGAASSNALSGEGGALGQGLRCGALRRR
jgi:hypothetical protein